jgi:itaconyl-CoA hydratase
MAVKPGWTGRVFEDFAVGDVYEHPLGRTLLAADNTWFTLLTQNTNPIHFDEVWSAQTEFGRPLINSCLTISLVTGQSVTDLSQNVVANLGWDEVKLTSPVFAGDTIYSRSEIVETRPSKSRPNAGIVKARTTGFNQDGTVVIEFLRTILVYRRGHVPEIARVTKGAKKKTKAGKAR